MNIARACGLRPGGVGERGIFRTSWNTERWSTRFFRHPNLLCCAPPAALSAPRPPAPRPRPVCKPPPDSAPARRRGKTQGHKAII